jgi:hypothetical protein
MPPITNDTPIDTSNTQFRQAVAFVTNTNEHLFLTGKAGTGKTTFLRYIREHCMKQCAVVAPTGVAAMNAGGETIHSFLQLPFGPFVPGNAGGFGRSAGETQDKHSLLANLRMNELKKKLIRRLQLLIIDEVSMVRADVMDAIDLVLRHVRRNYHQPFGGVQMVFIGDPFQLPPVVRDEDHEILRHFYPGPYFFDSVAIRQQPPVYIELKKIYRQKEQSFIDLLNRVRNGNALQEDINTLNERYTANPVQEDGYIMLCTHNHIADDINKQALAAIDAMTHNFDATITGQISDKSVPGERVLTLKKGAQVMFIKNDLQTPRRYYNGKIGKVDRIDAAGIQVVFPESNDTVIVPLETWKSVRYSLNSKGNVEEEETGSFTQFPLRLAWAVTVHKSQGLTLDKAVVDLNRAFAPGQVYVALSRCTSLGGIVLRSPLQLSNILVDERVVAFSEYEDDEEELEVALEEGELRAKSARLQQQFSFAGLVTLLQQQLPVLQKTKTGPREENIALQDKLFSNMSAAHVNAEKFCKLLHALVMNKEASRMHERMAAAVGYFDKQVLEPAILQVTAHLALLETHTKVVKQVRLWKDVKTELEAKLKEIRSVMPATA